MGVALRTASPESIGMVRVALYSRDTTILDMDSVGAYVRAIEGAGGVTDFVRHCGLTCDTCSA